MENTKICKSVISCMQKSTGEYLFILIHTFGKYFNTPRSCTIHNTKPCPTHTKSLCKFVKKCKNSPKIQTVSRPAHFYVNGLILLTTL